MHFKSFAVISAIAHIANSCPFHAPQAASANDLTRRSVPARFSKTAIRNVRVFDGNCFSSPRTVVIDNDRISFNDSDVATTIDATGLYLIPGLIDSHLHISSMAGLENVTSYGITTSMVMSCQNYTICRSLKNQAGLSDFRTAGLPAVGPNSSHATMQHLAPWQLAMDSSNATELVEWSKSNGSDYYKITLEVNGPSYDLTRRLVSASRELGLPTMSHASVISAYIQASNTGIEGIQHVPRDGNLSAETVQKIKANGQFVTPTLTVFAAALNPPDPVILSFLGSPNGPGNTSWVNVVQNAREIYKAGIPFLAGTDAVGPLGPNITIPFGSTLHQELGFFVKEIGLRPAEAINAATSVAAQYHRLSDRGSIKEGMRADLLLLGSDPLQDISNTKDIVGIWVAGRKYPGLPVAS